MLSPTTTEVPDILATTERSLMAPPCQEDPLAMSTAAAAAAAVTTTTMSTLDTCLEANCTTVLASRPGATIVSPLLLGIAGVTGQVWALCYLHGSARRHNARTVFYMFLCTLIWTDLLGKMLTTPPAVISYTAQGWVGGEAMCDYHGFVMVLFSMLTHFTVSAMAVERFLGICHGYFYSRNVTTSRCRYLLVGIWVFCTVFGLLPLFNIGQLFLQYPGTWCFANIHLCGSDTPLRHRIYTNTLGIINAANLLVIVFCNVVVVGTLLKMRLSRQMLCQPHRSRKQSEHEMQMVIVLVVITVVFVMSWAPLDTILLTTQMLPPHRTSEDHMPELIAVRLVSINQIVDPWAYIICRVAFRSRAWKCCRKALLGRGWSRRGEGGSSTFNMASLLHGRKLSRTQSPAKEQPAVINNAVLEQIENVATRPQPTKSTRVPSLQKSYYSDSGTGSYSGVEVPLLESPEGNSLTPEVLHGSKASALEQSLAKSLSVAIPIPLFTSEQYHIKEYVKEGPDGGKTQDQYQHMNGSYGTPSHRFARPIYRVTSTASAQDPTGSPFLVIHGCDDATVLRSNSWSCQSALPPRPQYRTQSTQTLSREYPHPQQDSLSPSTKEPPSSTKDPEALLTVAPLLALGDGEAPRDPPGTEDPPRNPEDDDDDVEVLSRET